MQLICVLSDKMSSTEAKFSPAVSGDLAQAGNFPPSNKTVILEYGGETVRHTCSGPVWLNGKKTSLLKANWMQFPGHHLKNADVSKQVAYEYLEENYINKIGEISSMLMESKVSRSRILHE